MTNNSFIEAVGAAGALSLYIYLARVFVDRDLPGVLSLFQSIAGATGDAFLDAFWKPSSIIVLLYLAFLPVLLGYSDPVAESDATNIYYLLSAQAQVIGTVLALIFTTTIVAAQLATRYSQHVLGRILDYWTLWYLLPYLVAVALPLFLLQVQPSVSAARTSLGLAGFCLVLLIPYFATLKERLSVTTYIDMWSGEVTEALDDVEEISGQAVDSTISDVLEKSAMVQGISLEALDSHDYSTFRKAIQVLDSMSLQLTAIGAKKAVAKQVGRLSNIGRERVVDPWAPFKIGEVLHKVVIACSQNKLYEVGEYGVEALERVALTSERENAERELTIYLLKQLGRVGEAVIGTDTRKIPRRAIRASCKVGMFSERPKVIEGAEANIYMVVFAASERLVMSYRDEVSGSVDHAGLYRLVEIGVGKLGELAQHSEDTEVYDEKEINIEIIRHLKKIGDIAKSGHVVKPDGKAKYILHRICDALIEVPCHDSKTAKSLAWAYSQLVFSKT